MGDGLYLAACALLFARKLLNPTHRITGVFRHETWTRPATWGLWIGTMQIDQRGIRVRRNMLELVGVVEPLKVNGGDNVRLQAHPLQQAKTRPNRQERDFTALFRRQEVPQILFKTGASRHTHGGFPRPEPRQ